MMANDVDLCAQAFLLLGSEPIQSFTDGTTESDLASAVYPTFRDGVLASYTWTFAYAQKDLSPLAAVPVADFTYAYQLPDEFLRAISIGDTSQNLGRGVPYRISERRLHCDIENVTLSYVARIDEQSWPAYFTEYMVNALQAKFCLSITENSTRSQILMQQAEISFQRAKTQDAQQQTPSAIEDFTLVNARFS